MSRTLIYVLADYGDLHDLAFAEVTQRIYAELGNDDFEICTFAVPAFDTVATGFALAQTAINSRLGNKHKFFVNTAPRKDDLTPRQKNSGEGLAYARLFNGVEIVAVNSGHSLSFVRDAAEDIRALDVSREGSQFRSRDLFPPAFAKIARGDYDALRDDLRDGVPGRPDGAVCYTDGYGNLKCSIDPEALEGLRGRDVAVTIAGHTEKALAAEGIFGVKDGGFSFARGSSGWELPDGGKVAFAEIVKRGGSAADAFGRPAGGAAVTWKPV